MGERHFRSSGRAFTAEEKARFEAAREQVAKDRPRPSREAVARKAELVALHDAMTALKPEREARGLSLVHVAERSGIDKSRLSELESDPRSYPTPATLTRIADAIGVKLEIHVASS